VSEGENERKRKKKTVKNFNHVHVCSGLQTNKNRKITIEKKREENHKHMSEDVTLYYTIPILISTFIISFLFVSFHFLPVKLRSTVEETRSTQQTPKSALTISLQPRFTTHFLFVFFSAKFSRNTASSSLRGPSSNARRSRAERMRGGEGDTGRRFFGFPVSAPVAGVDVDAGAGTEEEGTDDDEAEPLTDPCPANSSNRPSKNATCA